jgi:hypothetical protein
MADPKQAAATQLKNIEQKTGKSLDQLTQFVARSGLEKHGEVRSMLIEKLALGYGDANALAGLARARLAGATSGARSSSTSNPLAEIYSGKKAALMPLHEALIQKMSSLGKFEVAPKKAYVSLRRAKQFGMVGPGGIARLDIGLNMRAGVSKASARLKSLGNGKMCTHQVGIATAKEIDRELMGWLREAYESSG